MGKAASSGAAVAAAAVAAEAAPARIAGGDPGRSCSNGVCITEFAVTRYLPPSSPDWRPAPTATFWFTGRAGFLGHLHVDGSDPTLLYPLGTENIFHRLLQSILSGPDGNLWFTESIFLPDLTNLAAIGRMSPSGSVTEFRTEAIYGSMVAAPDGNLWIGQGRSPEALSTVNALVRMTTSGQVTPFMFPDPNMYIEQLTAVV